MLGVCIESGSGSWCSVQPQNLVTGSSSLESFESCEQGKDCKRWLIEPVEQFIETPEKYRTPSFKKVKNVSQFNNDQKWITDLEIHKCIQCISQMLTSCDYLSWQEFHHSFPFSLWRLREKFVRKGTSFWKGLDVWFRVDFLLPQYSLCFLPGLHVPWAATCPLQVTLNTVQTELSLLKIRHETSRSQFKQTDKVKY